MRMPRRVLEEALCSAGVPPFFCFFCFFFFFYVGALFERGGRRAAEVVPVAEAEVRAALWDGGGGGVGEVHFLCRELAAGRVSS
jgi:hypothetical protein